MILTSPSFENNGAIPRKFTCDGGGINPEFQIQNVPDGARSLALIVHDPDAPMPGGFTHWLVWNIRPITVFIKEESVPPGSVEGMNGMSDIGYLGPCPSHGPARHHYHFTLCALDAELSLPVDTDRVDLEAAIAEHLLEKAELVGTYELQKAVS